MLIVGLTGSIATGKSTVSARLKEQYNIPVVDADLIAKEVVAPGKPAYNDIKAYFGSLSRRVIKKNGEINRVELGKLVFGEKNKVHLSKLNSFTHPRVGQEMMRQVAAYYLKGHRIVILDVPLLFEANFHYYCGAIINVTCSPEIQLDRLMKRNPHLTAEEARNRINSQLSMDVKSDYSDFIISNDGSLEELYAQIDAVLYIATPSIYWALFELLTPFGFIMAGLIYVRNLARYLKFNKD